MYYVLMGIITPNKKSTCFSCPKQINQMNNAYSVHIATSCFCAYQEYKDKVVK